MASPTPVELTEARSLATAPAGPKELNIQLIDPGWGSSGYYSAQVLEQAAKDRVYPAGTHMYADHPTETEEMERPGRSIKDLAAVLVEDAYVGKEGALVARAKPLNGWGTVLKEMKDAIGVSIRATAMGQPGEVDGRRGLVVDRLVEGISVDFVTKAGRGGRILEVLESARTQPAEPDIPDPVPVPLPPAAASTHTESLLVDRVQLVETIRAAIADQRTAPPTNVTADAPSPAPTPTIPEESMGQPTGAPPATAAGPAEVTEARAATTPVSEAQRLQRLLEEAQLAHGRALARAEEAEAERDTAVRRATLVEAKWTAETRTKTALATSPLKEASYDAVIRDVCDGLALDEHGRVDESAVDTAIKTAIDKEQTKVAALLEAHGVGVPRGLGGGIGQPAQVTEAQFQERLADVFGDLGLDENTAKLAAKGR